LVAYRKKERHKKLMNKAVSKQIDLNGRIFKLETGVLAQQADAAVLATWGETSVLVTVASKKLKESIGYFPLSVEYVEKYYAGGRITGQKYVKREARPTEEAILIGRAIDRSIRPLFPKDLEMEVQVIISVLSYDAVNDPSILAFNAVSAALAISSVPWNGPLSGVRVGQQGKDFVINPVLTDLDQLDLNLLVASTADKVVMIEAEGKEVEDEVVFEGIKKGHEAAQTVVAFINDFVTEVGNKKLDYAPLAETIDPKVLKEAKDKAHTLIEEAFKNIQVTPWHEATGDNIKSELASEFAEKLTSDQISSIFDKVAKEIMNETVLNKGTRVDGRAMNQVRDLQMIIGLLPRTHGSAVFQRGTTQVMSITTLGPLSLSQTLEGMTGESMKRLMHHYNMGINPFSTGEVKRIGSPGRRDIGHGSLVEKSINGVLPETKDFPYAMRVVSEVLAANASTSMASLCASSLSLLNAGVPLKNPVAGIACGLLSKDDKFQVITDMQAVEDFYGEMDFKVGGSVKGVTAIQMDTKLTGLSFEIIQEALKQAREARISILEQMNKVLPKAGDLSKYAPKIEVTNIKPEEIGMLIGPGGKNINGIIAKTGAQIDIEDDGTVMISSMDQGAIDAARAEIEGMFKKIEVGEEYMGKVVRLAAFGAFVEIAPGKDGLVHVSQMAPYRVEDPADIVQEGQEIKVRVTEVSPDGKVGLSMLFGDDRKPESEARRGGGGGGDRNGGGDRGGFGGGGDRSGGGYNRDRGSSDRGGSSRGGYAPRRDSSGGGFNRSAGGERRGFGGGSRPSGGFDRGSRGGRPSTGGFNRDRRDGGNR
jgi:polyribonucleotide nucleotidyltransferase